MRFFLSLLASMVVGISINAADPKDPLDEDIKAIERGLSTGISTGLQIRLLVNQPLPHWKQAAERNSPKGQFLYGAVLAGEGEAWKMRRKQ